MSLNLTASLEAHERQDQPLAPLQYALAVAFLATFEQMGHEPGAQKIILTTGESIIRHALTLDRAPRKIRLETSLGHFTTEFPS